MEVFDVNECTDSRIDLTSERQLESLYEKIKDSAEILIRWEDEDRDGNPVKKSKILLTDNLMSRIKDGRFTLTASESGEEDED